MGETTVFEARRIITMDPSRPEATHVAVKDGRIQSVGAASDFAGMPVERRFAEAVILPGFVEGHAHVMEGTLWKYTYVGAGERRNPAGQKVAGLASVDAVIARLAQAHSADPGEGVLVGWGFDPLHIAGARLTRRDLDRISPERPIVVFHASLHIIVANSRVLELTGFTSETAIAGVVKQEDGEPSGELQGIAPRLRLLRALGWTSWTGDLEPADVTRFAAAAQVQGITTIADLHNDLPASTVDIYRAACTPDLPVRIVPALASASCPPEEGVARIAALRAENTERLKFGLVKIIVDGSIQGFTARLGAPGYHNGAPNGLWYVAPEDLKRIVGIYHAAGVQLHIHTNGDEATDAALDAVACALETAPRADHRHTLQHCQMARPEQLARAKALGLCVNLFSNHLYYWGDVHRDVTIGPARVARMNPAASALRMGIAFSIHSDAPVTPLGPLFVAWCAVNRMSSSGAVLGPEERLSVPQALHAITLGAAYTLHMDTDIGSITPGKQADFVVLADDPLTTPPEALKDIAILATMVGGAIHPAARA